ncbi:MAG: hypothetical protein IJN13_06140 [Bacilli bacterium]|nr:hypothetical protein [Bacilli bacterium]
MKFINKKIILVVIILMIGIIFLGISKPKDKINLESVNLKSNKDNSMFAIMLEQEDGTYKEDNSNTWPADEIRIYDQDKSGCVDTNGNKIENSLSYNIDTKNVSIRTKEASSCYIYFSFPPYMCDDYNNAAECLINETDVWNSGLEDDGYRYVGEITDNYICFGTNDKNACINNTEKYMYRIIGIFEDSKGNQHLKLIKKEYLNINYEWQMYSKININWDESDTYSGLNGRDFLTNSIYVPEKWSSKIADWNYIMANTLTYENYVNNGVYGPHYTYTNGETVYLHEMNKNTKTSKTCYYNASVVADCSVGKWDVANAKIGLMYVSDYILSYGDDGLEYISNNGISYSSWLNLANNGYTISAGDYDLTMTNFGLEIPNINNNYFNSWFVLNNNKAYAYTLTWYGYARPVFYLTNDVKLKSGNGSIMDPFIIE